MSANETMLKENLQSRLERLLTRGKAITRDLRTDHDRDSVERASELFNDEVLEGLDALTRAEVQQIRDALTRIDQNRYGRCAVCGQPIGSARLTAEPTATTCVSCAPS